MNIVRKINSSDGSRKYLFTAENIEKTVEATFFLHTEQQLPYLCISSQFGCAVGCIFCETGRQKSQGNMSTEQIVQQVENCRSDLLQTTPGSSPMLDTILFAGMGEPMLNIVEVKKAAKLFKEKGSSRRVTMTTVGILPKFEELYDFPLDMLSISLHATTDDVREKIIPVGSKYRIDSLLDHIHRYQASTGTSIIMNYLLFQGLNDTDRDIDRLAGMLNPQQLAIKLKYFNEVSAINGISLKASTRFAEFADRLRAQGFNCMIDVSKGTDIWGGCGQLRSQFRTLRPQTVWDIKLDNP